MARALPLLVALLVVPAASATPNGPGGTTRTSVTIPLAPAFAPLDLVPPAAANWATNGGDYGQTRYSSLKEITKVNVRRLKLKWHVHLNGSGTGSKYKGEGTPLVYKGIMYTVTGAGDVFALDATDGTILWQYGADLPQAMNTVCCGWANRGLALGDGKVSTRRSWRLLSSRAVSSGASRTATGRTDTR